MPLTTAQFRERRKALADRLKRTGLHAAFLRKVREIKDKSASSLPPWMNEIAASLAAEFQPTDGSPPEFTLDDYQERLEKLNAQTLTPEASQVAAVLVGAIQGAEDHAERTRKINAKWENFRRAVARAVKSGRSRVSDDEVTVVRWVFKRAGTPVDEIDPLEVPGEGAVKLLRMVQDDSEMYREFIKSHMQKLLTKTLDSDVSGGYADDRKQLRLMDRLDDIEAGDDDETAAEILSLDKEDTLDELDPRDFDDADTAQAVSEPEAGTQG